MKFKNIKKKVYIKKSPRISRSIPESPKFSFPKIHKAILSNIHDWALKLFVATIFMVAAIIVGYNLQNNLQIKEKNDLQRKAVARDLNFWEDFISKHQNYRDAYFQASILEYKLGDIAKAKTYVEKGLALDPNSENGRKIEKLLK